MRVSTEDNVNNLSWGSLGNPPITFLPANEARAAASSMPKEYALFRIDGKYVDSEAALHEVISKAMHFPPYFGRNWDALNDCLGDLSWAPARGYAIFLSNGEGFIKTRPLEFRIFSDIIESVSAYWAEQHVEFVLVIETRGETNSLS